MLRGCLFGLALYAALAWGYCLWFGQRFEGAELYIASAFVGFVVLCCLGALGNAWSAFRTAGRLASAAFARPWGEGETIAAEGVVEPLGRTVRGPFSGAACVCCEYELARAAPPSSDEGKPTGRDVVGFLMEPWAVRTERGPLRVLGFPDLKELPETTLTDPASARRARDFLRTTPLEKTGVLQLGKLVSALIETWRDDDGRVERHLSIREADWEAEFPAWIDQPPSAAATSRHDSRDADDDEEAYAEDAAEDELDDLEADDETEADEDSEEDDESEEDDDYSEEAAYGPLPTMIEKRIHVGQQVTIVGTYRSALQGLSPRSANEPTKLYLGSAADHAGRLRRSAWGYLIGGTLFLVLTNLLAWAVVQLPKA